MSKNTNSPRTRITQLGMMFQIRGYVGLGLGIIYVILTVILFTNYLSDYENAVHMVGDLTVIRNMVEWLTIIANYRSSSLLIAILFMVGFLFLNILVLISFKKTMDNRSYTSHLLQFAYTLFLIGIITSLFISILSYIFQGILLQDLHGLISNSEGVDEQMLDTFFAKSQSISLIFGILFLLEDGFYVIIYYFWYRWGKSLPYDNLVSDNKKRVNLGFLFILIANCIGIIESIIYLLSLNVSKLGSADEEVYSVGMFLFGMWLYCVGMILGEKGRILVGYYLMHFPAKQISPQIIPLELSTTTKTFNEKIEPSTPSDAIFCSYCGNKLPADSIFCKKCGRKVGNVPQ